MRMALIAVALALTTAATPIFQFETGEFWLNLHHFLYVLGRAEARTADSGREAVKDAPADAERGLAALSDAEKQAWAEAVHAYAIGPGTKDLIFDRALAAMTAALGRAKDSSSLVGGGVDPSVIATLERAAPLYRKAWWPAHRAANERWRVATQALVDERGATVLAFVTKAYRMPWPEAGYPINVSAYANWAGAYSTDGNLLVASSLDRGTAGSLGLETVFHEAMHQWDEAMQRLLGDRARATGKRLPPNVSHAMIFYTAGEAVKRAIPGHVPSAEALGVWARGFAGLRDALAETWQPYLDGNGTRDDAIAALVEKVGR